MYKERAMGRRDTLGVMGIKEGEEQLLVSWGFREKVLFKLSLEG